MTMKGFGGVFFSPEVMKPQGEKIGEREDASHEVLAIRTASVSSSIRLSADFEARVNWAAALFAP